MKKKKLLGQLGMIGALAASIVPLATVVSCGTNYSDKVLLKVTWSKGGRQYKALNAMVDLYNSQRSEGDYEVVLQYVPGGYGAAVARDMKDIRYGFMDNVADIIVDNPDSAGRLGMQTLNMKDVEGYPELAKNIDTNSAVDTLYDRKGMFVVPLAVSSEMMSIDGSYVAAAIKNKYVELEGTGKHLDILKAKTDEIIKGIDSGDWKTKVDATDKQQVKDLYDIEGKIKDKDGNEIDGKKYAEKINNAANPLDPDKKFGDQAGFNAAVDSITSQISGKTMGLQDFYSKLASEIEISYSDSIKWNTPGHKYNRWQAQYPEITKKWSMKENTSGDTFKITEDVLRSYDGMFNLANYLAEKHSLSPTGGLSIFNSDSTTNMLYQNYNALAGYDLDNFMFHGEKNTTKFDYSKLTGSSDPLLEELVGHYLKAANSGALHSNQPGKYGSADQQLHDLPFTIGSTAGYYYNVAKPSRGKPTWSVSPGKMNADDYVGIIAPSKSWVKPGATAKIQTVKQGPSFIGIEHGGKKDIETIKFLSWFYDKDSKTEKLLSDKTPMNVVEYFQSESYYLTPTSWVEAGSPTFEQKYVDHANEIYKRFPGLQIVQEGNNLTANGNGVRFMNPISNKTAEIRPALNTTIASIYISAHAGNPYSNVASVISDIHSEMKRIIK